MTPFAQAAAEHANEYAGAIEWMGWVFGATAIIGLLLWPLLTVMEEWLEDKLSREKGESSEPK